jgi:hypothetical protein
VLAYNTDKSSPSYCDGKAFVPIYESPYGGASNNPGADCYDIKIKRPAATSGNYWIKPDNGAAFEVYCDMATDGGGWWDGLLLPLTHIQDVLLHVFRASASQDGDHVVHTLWTEWLPR